MPGSLLLEGQRTWTATMGGALLVSPVVAPRGSAGRMILA